MNLLLIAISSIFKIARYCAVISSWVNGSLAVTHDPCDPSKNCDPFDPFIDPWPISISGLSRSSDFRAKIKVPVSTRSTPGCCETHDDIMVVLEKSQYGLVLEPLPEVVLNNLFLIPK